MLRWQAGGGRAVRALGVTAGGKAVGVTAGGQALGVTAGGLGVKL